MRLLLAAGLLTVVALESCSSAPGPPPVPPPVPAIGAADGARPSPELPAMPEVRGPLSIRVIYPPRGAAIAVRDSSFLFGSVGTGAAHLTINDHPVRVWPNGAWLAWIPFPRDSIMRFHIAAATGTDTARVQHEVRRMAQVSPDSLSIAPQGKVWWPADEYLPVTVRAPAGAAVRIRLPGNVVVPLAAAARESTRYTGALRGRATGPHPGALLDTSRQAAVATKGSRPAADSLVAYVEAIRHTDTMRTPWPLELALLDTVPKLVYLDDDTAGLGDTDGITVGRALPGGTYQWFFPAGTRSVVSGRVNGDLRLRLSAGTDVWVAAAEAKPLPGGAAAAPAVAGSVMLQPFSDRVTLRLPLSARVPFQVVENERSLQVRLYGTAGDIDWTWYGKEDSLVQRVTWSQAPGPDVTVAVELGAPVWGYRARWEHNVLLLEIRRPPVIERGEPLRGRLIAVDAGHPPAGAVGPTGLREAEANLAVAMRLRKMLEAAGATVLMTRAADTAVDLWPRIKLADSLSADLLVSIHNNALPDGINPFVNSGTSVFYNQPRSLPLAREIQRALLRRLGLRDLGVARGDLALVRPTWMPSVLCEGFFMMMPEQEAALRTAEGQEQYARAVYEGIREFLRQRERGGDR